MEPDLFSFALEMLKRMIAIPSFSREEDKVASMIQDALVEKGLPVKRQGNNLWVTSKSFDPEKPTILLNSHHDTVKPNPQYTRDPFSAEILDGKLYGLGSNDAGGPLVALISAFLHYYEARDLAYNLVLSATAEEEISGTGGIESIWKNLPVPAFAIVGEPTQCQMATAEKGLMVLDCVANGKAGHAARDEGINAIYEAMTDIDWFRSYRFENVSKTLGPVKMTVTIINAGKQHNVVPAECSFTVDVRVTDAYSLEQVLEIVRKHVKCDVKPRSLRMRPSGIPDDHILVEAAKSLGLHCYGSPTTSDQALIPVPSIKMGPGDSARSHTADEFIGVDEIQKGIAAYISVLDYILKPKKK